MAYVAPSTVTTLQTYTSAAHNIIVNDIIDHEARLNSYAGVYTNEAARDAAITSPTEGMSVYLTAPTVPTATGAITAIPTGVTTIYNGSVWVCVTPVAAKSNTGASTTSTSYVTTLTGDATALSVTLVTGTTAYISMHGNFSNNTSTASTYISYSVSGATTIAASDTNGQRFQVSDSYNKPIIRVGIVTGLTAGTNTFTFAYRCSTSAATSYFDSRDIVVAGIS